MKADAGWMTNKKDFSICNDLAKSLSIGAIIQIENVEDIRIKVDIQFHHMALGQEYLMHQEISDDKSVWYYQDQERHLKTSATRPTKDHMYQSVNLPGDRMRADSVSTKSIIERLAQLQHDLSKKTTEYSSYPQEAHIEVYRVHETLLYAFAKIKWLQAGEKNICLIVRIKEQLQ